MSKSNKDACYFDLKHRILTTDLAPGKDLDEVSLTQVYGISRTPLREVFQRLSGEGYLQLAANRGAKVSPLDLPAVRSFFQTAPMIYASIARFAAEHRTKEQLDALGEAQENLRRATENRDGLTASLANHRFHAMIGQMAGNPYLMTCLARLLIDDTRLSRGFFCWTNQRDAQRIIKATGQHDALIDALKSQDAKRVVNLTVEHWRLSQSYVEATLRPHPLSHDLAVPGHNMPNLFSSPVGKQTQHR